jgi:short-subunit dehydrogenase
LKELTEKYNLPFVGLVNNAGIGGNYSPLEFQDMEYARKLLDTNVFGLLDLTQLSLPLLRQSQGRLVMISSLSGIFSLPLSGIYSASKFALEALSDALRRELAPHNVSVSVVQPGYVKTQIIKSSMKSIQEQDQEMLTLYPTASVAKRERMAEMMERMPGPEVTTTPAILHALTAAFPKTRYPVAEASGLSAKTLTWVSWILSDRIKDLVFK